MFTKLLNMIKTALDILPLNGAKTLLGVLILILATKFSIPAELVNPLLKYLGLDLTTLGLLVTAAGAVHAKLKAIA